MIAVSQFYEENDYYNPFYELQPLYLKFEELCQEEATISIDNNSGFGNNKNANTRIHSDKKSKSSLPLFKEDYLKDSNQEYFKAFLKKLIMEHLLLTDFNTFLTCMGRKRTEKIKWLGQFNELKYLLDQLQVKRLIIKSKFLVTAAQIFTNKYGENITSKNISGANYKNKKGDWSDYFNKKGLDEAIRILAPISAEPSRLKNLQSTKNL